MDTMDVRRERFRAEAALMAEMADLASRPDADAGTFAAIQRLAEKGRGLDPVASTRAEAGANSLMAPTGLVFGLVFGLAALGANDAGDPFHCWLAAAGSAGFTAIGIFSGRAALAARRSLRGIVDGQRSAAAT